MKLKREKLKKIILKIKYIYIMDSLINEKKRLENHIALRKTEVKHLENVVNEIQQKIYTLCEHEFVNEVESGIYPETYYVCRKCGYEK
tara:strand:+ start:116 stop:379 length:264 start_codon:yes stop_codon:yes gene_type:complete